MSRGIIAINILLILLIPSFAAAVPVYGEIPKWQIIPEGQTFEVPTQVVNERYDKIPWWLTTSLDQNRNKIHDSLESVSGIVYVGKPEDNWPDTPPFPTGSSKYSVFKKGSAASRTPSQRSAFSSPPATMTLRASFIFFFGLADDFSWFCKRVFVGCDSHLRGRSYIFAFVIAIYPSSGNGRFFFQRKKFESLILKSNKARLLEEGNYSIMLGSLVRELVGKDIEIHTHFDNPPSRGDWVS